MANQANIKAVITAEDKASAVIKGFDNQLGNLAGTVKNLLVGAVSIAGLSIAFDKLTDFVIGSVHAFAEEELVTKRLQAGINNVSSATDKNIDGLLKQAAALQKVTRFSDEQVISAQGILSTFQLNQSAIERLTPRLLDMSEGIARVSGGLPDLEGNAILVAKALGGEDVVGLVGALRRVGVVMTAHQEDLLKTGDMQTRLATITGVLDQNFKGMGETAGNTTAGHLAQLSHSIDDLKERLGGAIAKAIDPFIQKLSAWAQTDQAQQTMDNIANKIVLISVVISNFLKNNWPAIESTLKTWARLAGDVADAIGFIAENVGKVVKIIDKSPGGISGFLKSVGHTLNLPGFAAGVQNFGGGLAMVGEQGPELVNLPRGSDVIPQDKIRSVGGSVHLSVNVGIYAGTEMEKRKLAEELMNSYQDLMSARGLA